MIIAAGLNSYHGAQLAAGGRGVRDVDDVVLGLFLSLSVANFPVRISVGAFCIFLGTSLPSPERQTSA